MFTTDQTTQLASVINFVADKKPSGEGSGEQEAHVKQAGRRCWRRTSERRQRRPTGRKFAHWAQNANCGQAKKWALVSIGALLLKWNQGIF